MALQAQRALGAETALVAGKIAEGATTPDDVDVLPELLEKVTDENTRDAVDTILVDAAIDSAQSSRREEQDTAEQIANEIRDPETREEVQRDVDDANLAEELLQDSSNDPRYQEITDRLRKEAYDRSADADMAQSTLHERVTNIFKSVRAAIRGK